MTDSFDGPGRETPPGRLVLRLYVAGKAPQSTRAQANLCEALGGCRPGSYELEIIDVLKEPRRALDDGVIVTPTLLKLSPTTAQMIGSLRDRAQLIEVLGLDDYLLNDMTPDGDGE